MPSQTQARRLLAKSITLPDYAYWSFDEYFESAALEGSITGEDMICLTPVRWIEAGMLGPNVHSEWHREDVEITQLSKMSDMFQRLDQRIHSSTKHSSWMSSLTVLLAERRWSHMVPFHLSIPSLLHCFAVTNSAIRTPPLTGSFGP